MLRHTEDESPPVKALAVTDLRNAKREGTIFVVFHVASRKNFINCRPTNSHTHKCMFEMKGFLAMMQQTSCEFRESL